MLLLPAPLLLLLLVSIPDASAQPQTFFPPAVPLAVRSPAFNTWLDTRNGANPMTTWPTFWNDEHIDGWAGYIRVDGVAYHWLGNPVPGQASSWRGTTITPTRTILNVQAGPMQLNVTFLSPIEPDDLSKQSFPFSYVYVDGVSTDGQVHNVQLYADISAEWVTNGAGTPINWQTQQTSNAVYLQVQSTTPSSIFQDVPEDSTAFHAIASTQPGRQSIIGTDQFLRPQVASNVTTLTLTSDLSSTSTGLVDNNGKFPVFAHLVDLGSVSTIPSVAWAVGVLRDPIVTFQGVTRHGYWWAEHGTIGDAINAFITDFPAAKTRALALDQKILADANAISQEYADVVSLGLRQALAGVEITVSSDGSSFNTSDVLAFMKDVGNTQRVNPTETIYALMPALVYLNASLIGPLIEPLLRFQSSGSSSTGYASPDLGTPYPSVPGNTENNEGVGVEHSGNMLVLALAHARGSGDGSILGRYYTLLKSYADFLANNTFGSDQQTADSRENVLGQTHANITNLGVKGIVGVQAMAQISEIMGDAAGATKYKAIAANLTQKWGTMSVFGSGSSTGLAWEYSDAGSSGLMYNLFADKLLKLNAFPSLIYQAQVSQLSTTGPLGVPLSSDSNFMTRSDWTLFTAAALSDSDAATRDRLISGVHARASHNDTNGTFANVYNVQTGAGIVQGSYPNGFATPAQGAMLSVLSLSVPNKTVIVPSGLGTTTNNGSKKKTSILGPVLGGVVGGLALIALVGITAVFFIRRRRQRAAAWNDPIMTSTDPRPWRPPPTFRDASTSGASGGGGFDTARATGMPSVESPPGSTTSGSRAYVPGTPSSAPYILSSSKTAQLLERDRLLAEEPPHGSYPPPPASVSDMSGSGSGTGTGSGTHELRTELASLRREMEELRAQQQDAPPMYQ
ncbi:DUF1793-domain-containing protein [Mycena amicta]|nr:DUF1793-domain-containing protein [Mycena amicta]